MQFSATILALAAASLSVASAAQNVSYTTQVVTAYTTYCPEATKITYGANTYTVTKPTTLTISDCPCTVSVPVYTSTATTCSTCTTVTHVPTNAIHPPPVSHPAINATASSPPSPPAIHNPSTAASISAHYNATASKTGPQIATFTGAAASRYNNMVGGAAVAGGLVCLMALMSL